MLGKIPTRAVVGLEGAIVEIIVGIALGGSWAIDGADLAHWYAGAVSG